MAMNKALRRSRQTALHLMVITGPSPTAAKARCFIELDGFGIQVYGARDSDESPKDNGESTPRPQEKTDPSSPQQNDISSPPNIEESLQDEEEDVSSSEQGLEADNESILSSVSESCDEDQESDVDPGESSFISSISEAVSHMSLASDASTTSGSTCSSSDCDEYSESEDSLDLPEEPEIMESTNLEVQQNVPVVKADDEKFIASSVRSLSLAMASCCDFSRDDLAPTQVHLFLRAPRRFNHSSWLPKQNLQKSLDERLFSFFGQNGGNTKVFEEGVRVACELKLQEADEGQDSEKDSDSEEVDPEDDMIWWQWNAAPIRGFSDI
ncbi:hypothetical protein FRC03_004314 [Tulasnella sp. 419]|nr:hypothetical protein FRC03_004314 [Tulasnella sp. 419]